MENSKIEWTDHTFNPWEGCTKVSPGCAHCYAETRNARWNGGTAPNWGKGAPRRRTSAAKWKEPLKWERETRRGAAGAPGEGETRRPRVFCASLADWLDDEVPLAWLIDLLDLIVLTPNLDWQLLTKRPENFRRRLEMMAPARISAGWWLDGTHIPPNVWIGTTVEDQTRADERIPHLLAIPAKVRFLSCEPLLSAVDLRRCDITQGADPRRTVDPLLCDRSHGGFVQGRIHWVIAGGESGPGARPMHPAWARGLRDQCRAADVPFFFKQWGEWAPRMAFYNDEDPDQPEEPNCGVVQPGGLMVPMCKDAFLHQPPLGSWWVSRVGKKKAGRLLDGKLHDAFPICTQPPRP